jgi:hypothetical protein
MDPDHAPLPTPWNLPFHPVAGIQTSTLITESLVGAIVACTDNTLAGELQPRRRAHHLLQRDPAGMDCAEVIVVFASLSVLRLSQGAAMAGTTAITSTASRTKSKVCRVFMMETSLLVHTISSKQTPKSTV